MTWQSKKQQLVARSSAKAKFRALPWGICEGIWLNQLVGGFEIDTFDLIKMICDRQSAILISKKFVHHDKTKHFKIDRYFISEKIEGNMISLSYVPSRQQVTDILTKGMFQLHWFNEYIASLRGSVGNQTRRVINFP